MREVAARAGCSVCTVSKALRDDPKISAETRKQVQALARDMGYRPSPALSRVAGRRASARADDNEPLAFIQSVSKELPRPPEMGGRALQGAREQAELMGYRLEVYEPSEFTSLAQMERTMYARGVQGIVLGEFAGKHPESLPFRWERFAAAWISQRWLPLDFPVVRPSFLKVLRYGVEKLEAYGFRRIGSILACRHGAYFEHFAQLGALLAMREERREETKVLPPLVCDPGDLSPDVASYLEEHQPDALLVQDTRTHWMLIEQGFHIPEDFATVAIYLPEPPGIWGEGLAGLQTDQELIGREAVNLVDSALRHGRYGPGETKEVIVPHRFRWGASLGVPPLEHDREPVLSKYLESGRKAKTEAPAKA